jgi:hypothetical protein
VNDSFVGRLRNWEPGDNPWANCTLAWFLSNCDFVRKCNGDEFVNNIMFKIHYSLQKRYAFSFM